MMERSLEKGANSVALGNPLQRHLGERAAPPATPVMFNASQDVEHAGVAAVKKPSSVAWHTVNLLDWDEVSLHWAAPIIARKCTENGGQAKHRLLATTVQYVPAWKI